MISQVELVCWRTLMLVGASSSRLLGSPAAAAADPLRMCGGM